MSGVAGLYNVPGTQEELNEWACIHATHHRDINQEIFRLTGILLGEFPLDPIPLNAPGACTYQHQSMHAQFEAVLGIAGFDLTDVNLQDRNQLEGWIFLNASLHTQAANI